MKKILLSLIVTLCALSSHAQVIEIFENGKLKETYTNTPNEHYVVKFHSTGDYDQINGHDYVIIGGLKWATMNVGATTVANDNATAFGDFYAWGEVDTYYKEYTDTKVLWKTSNLTHIPGTKNGHNWPNYSGTNTFQEWSPVPYDDKYQLTTNYDVARAKWGGTWRIPTMDEIMKLYEACVDKSYSSIGPSATVKAALKPLPEGGTITKGGIYGVPQNSTVDGFPYNVQGVLFVMMDDPNQRIFFPAAGNIQSNKRDGVGTLCTYWSANAFADDNAQAFAHALYISLIDLNDPTKNGIIMNKMLSRCLGFSIRPVSD